MFHIELREAPHSLHRFNLTDPELATVLQRWVQGEQVELGERVWSPKAGEILVLQGPEIPIGRLTMGRGWSVAQREGEDVTERVLASVRETLTEAATASVQTAITAQRGGATSVVGVIDAVSAADAEVLADALGLELLRNLGETPMSLVSAWRTALQRHPTLPLGAALDLTQRAVASLARSRLVAVSKAGEAADRGLQGAELDAALAEIDSWTAESGAGALWLRRLR